MTGKTLKVVVVIWLACGVSVRRPVGQGSRKADRRASVESFPRFELNGRGEGGDKGETSSESTYTMYTLPEDRLR